MAKDKRLGELPGITDAATVALNRIGIVTIHDLLAAEFDRVAYIVDDYNEAARLLREAKKIADVATNRRGARSTHIDPLVPSPLSPSPAPTTARSHHRTSMQGQAAQPPSPQPPPPPQQPAHPADSAALMQAMAALAHGLSLAGASATKDRDTLARRLAAAATLVNQGASEPELIVCALLEGVESGATAAEDIGPRFGRSAEELLDECCALRAVPMLPTGKPPRYYLEMAKNASRESRRVCAAHLLAALEDGPDTLPGGSWHAKLLLEGLEAAGPDELVAAVRAALNGSRRAAA